jgi:hypothetical protein
MMAVMRKRRRPVRRRDEARAQLLAAQLAEPGGPDAATLLAEKLAGLKGQLKAARTRIQNLSVEKLDALLMFNALKWLVIDG